MVARRGYRDGELFCLTLPARRKEKGISTEVKRFS